MNKNVILKWHSADQANLRDTSLAGPGLYMFVMRDCGHPYYVGTAKNSLSERLRKHESNFNEGLRTYLTRHYFGRLKSPAEHWAAALNMIDMDGTESRSKDIYIAGVDTAAFELAQSLEFWTKRLSIVVAPLEDQVEITQLKRIESAIQYRLEDHLIETLPHLADYVNTRIPGVRSSLFGRRECPRGASAAFEHDWSNLGSEFSQVRKVLPVLLP